MPLVLLVTKTQQPYEFDTASKQSVDCWAMTQFLAELELATRALYIPINQILWVFIHIIHIIIYLQWRQRYFRVEAHVHALARRSIEPVQSFCQQNLTHEMLHPSGVVPHQQWEALQMIAGRYKIMLHGGCRMVKWLIWNMSESDGKFLLSQRKKEAIWKSKNDLKR